jgi:propionate catabolism operon transcriptional regulator
MAGKIRFYLPKIEDEPLVREIFDRSNDGACELEIAFVTGARQILATPIAADAVIARGIAAAAARRAFKDIPVVELLVTGYDLMRAVTECRERFAVDKVAVVGVPGMIFGVQAIERLINCKLEAYPINDEDEAASVLKKVGESGISTIIGGGTACKAAAAMGLNGVLIHSGEEAIFQALAEAKRVISVRRFEQERAEQFRTILDFSLEGIVAVDANGDLNLINKAASELAGINEEHLGRKAGASVPQLRLEQVLRSGRPELGLVETIFGQQVAINSVPIMIKDRPVGAVATFQQVKALQEFESKIRRKIYKRGLTAKLQFGNIISENAGMRKMVRLAEEYSRVDSNVLILGETGAGKEVFAQSIHNASARRYGPFVPVNCAALPETLLESELFGYVEGAFTGAAKGGKVGLFEQAHRGTIFLDEIAEVTPGLQGRLLRVLQEKEIMRLGDERLIPVDVRIVAATNQDLRELVKTGKFRADLYYRLDILRLEVPPLRERPEDILPLLKSFIKNYATRFHKTEKDFAPAARQLLLRHAWPGNVRELRSIAERLTVLAGGGGGFYSEEDVRAVLFGEETKGTVPREAAPAQAAAGTPLRRKKRAAELERIREVLARTNYDAGKAVEILGISRTTLWRRLRELEGQEQAPGNRMK